MGDLATRAAFGKEKTGDTVEQAVVYIAANKLKSLAVGKTGYSTAKVAE